MTFYDRRPCNLQGVFAIMAALATMAVLIGCQGANPVKAAETVEQKAFALYGLFTVFEEFGADVIETDGVPSDIKRGIQHADAVAKPIADALLDAALEVQRIRAQVLAEDTNHDRLALVLANLSDWVVRAEPAITRLVAAVNEGLNR